MKTKIKNDVEVPFYLAKLLAWTVLHFESVSRRHKTPVSGRDSHEDARNTFRVLSNVFRTLVSFGHSLLIGIVQVSLFIVVV
jgi:hypothetical protein